MHYFLAHAVPNPMELSAFSQIEGNFTVYQLSISEGEKLYNGEKCELTITAKCYSCSLLFPTSSNMEFVIRELRHKTL